MPVPPSRVAAALAALLLLVGAGPATSPVDVPEPDGIYAGPQHGYTPQSLRGATVVDLAALDALVAGGEPILIDVALADRKPAGFPSDRPWLPSHRSLPGAVWMPNAGAEPLTPEQGAAFLARVAELTGGDKSRPIVTFCHPDCWGSWNAGKRLVLAGYARVHWFPSGIEGWQDAHETAVVRRDPAWARVDGSASAGDAQR